MAYLHLTMRYNAGRDTKNKYTNIKATVYQVTYFTVKIGKTFVIGWRYEENIRAEGRLKYVLGMSLTDIFTMSVKYSMFRVTYVPCNREYFIPLKYPCELFDRIVLWE